MGAALEGDLVPLLAGVLTHLGLASPVTAVVASALGLLTGDSVWFWIGRRSGARLERTRAWQRVGPTVARLAGRFGPLEIAVARVAYGARNVSMLFWGTQGLSYGRFLAVDAPAAVAWTGLLVGLGHFASGGAEAVLGEVERVERWLLGALVVTVALIALRRRVGSSRRDDRRPHRPPA